MKKRIVIFDGTLQQGGAERVISILSRKMNEIGYEVEILLYHDRDIFYDIHPDVKITTVEKNTKSKSIIKNVLWIRKFFKNNADIVLSFLAPFNIIALVAHAGLKSKIVVADRNDPRHVPSNTVVRKLRDFLYRFADGIVVQTLHNKVYFSKTVKKKSVIIFNPIDLGEKAGLALRTPKKRKIVSVGRLMPQKNQEMILSAFAKVSEAFPEYDLYIYGEGPERSRLEKKAQSLNIQDKLHLPGSVKDVFEQIADAELFVLSSDYEGMPNALIEAMCLGLPSITTRVSGAEDLIDCGVNGEIVELGDVEELSKKMAQMLSNEHEKLMIAQNATELCEKLNVDVIMKQWTEYISKF